MGRYRGHGTFARIHKTRPRTARHEKELKASQQTTPPEVDAEDRCWASLWLM